MFDIAPTEFLLVAVVALVVIGPKDLPRVMRAVGKWVGKARRVAGQFRSGIDTMIRESELADLEKQWAAENERIMRDHPPAALPAPAAPQPAAPEVEDHGPVMVEKPAIKSDAEPVAVPAPEKRKHVRKSKAEAPAFADAPVAKRARKPRAAPVAVEAPVVAPAPKRARKPKAPAGKAES